MFFKDRHAGQYAPRLEELFNSALALDPLNRMYTYGKEYLLDAGLLPAGWRTQWEIELREVLSSAH